VTRAGSPNLEASNRAPTVKRATRRLVNPEGMKIAYQELTERIRQIPGVSAADISTLVPLGGGSNEGQMLVVVRAEGSIANVMPAVRNVLHEEGDDRPIYNVRT
jgi:hypothetical protein